ncbi:GDP-L-fucose synthase [Solidesulfovibrio carbinoliphilus subsp. oakridgensis]|uniref:GDP-L-fucose synthase n=1 Tax=Solidesulfovibrio carbinoliphilus subsp. oakridgensis TaxID=694327 RepID=G7Q796_9BACT|nr:GDP-L-fucose synthase [Solidesulfovibrio carbinoliphilus]EHJ49053.1 GDP-L-fucose synthase [Solidesulfovibrio carbinoliphilus subsp. oakridgensis]
MKSTQAALPGGPVYVAGHRGLVGAAIVRALAARGAEVLTRTHAELDLTDQTAVRAFFAAARPAAVFLAAAKVGGIHANDTYPADFIRDNLLIQTNVIDAAYQSGAKRLVFLGSSCIYPRLAPQPMREESLLTGPLEATNQWYAIAKIAGIKMCQAYRRQYGFSAISLMPTNLYGPGDNFTPVNSHVIPGLMRRFHEARLAGADTVTVWGTGNARREFLHVDDMAGAAVACYERYDDEEIINIGSGEEVTIRELAERMARVTGFSGRIVFDAAKPDGTPRKALDIGRLTSLGWAPTISLADGLAGTYRWFLDNIEQARLA